MIVTAMKQSNNKDYTFIQSGYQLKLPLNLETVIASDDPVRLLSQFVEELNLTDLYATYDRIRKNTVSPRQMLKIVIYAAMNRLYSSRDIETACTRDINFMYLLEGLPAPDHASIARFRTLHFSCCSENILAQMSEWLYRNVLAESIIVAMARNINKLHAKIQSDRTDVHLYSLKEA